METYGTEHKRYHRHVIVPRRLGEWGAILEEDGSLTFPPDQYEYCEICGRVPDSLVGAA